MPQTNYQFCSPRIPDVRRIQTSWKAAIVLTLIVLISNRGHEAFAQSFHPIEIPSVPFSLHRPVASVLDISPDGSRVAGAISENGVDYECGGLCTLPFIWTLSGGTETMGLLGPVQLYATEYRPITVSVEEIRSISNTAALANGAAGYFNEAFLVQNNRPSLIREVNSQSPALYGTSISDIGGVIVGSIIDREFRSQPFMWTNETGVVPLETDQLTARFTAVSGDGRVAGGTSGTSLYDPYAKAFRWTEEAGIEYLDSIHPKGGNYPSALSTDGSTMAGTARGELGFLAYRWTSNEGTQPLPIPQGFIASAADGISADGEIVVGRLMVIDHVGRGGTLGWVSPHIYYLIESPMHLAEQSHAMIWDSVNGTRLLKAVLSQDYGLSDALEGWALVSASAISSNGKVIAGVGVNPTGEFQGWVAILAPEPHSTLIIASCIAILSFRRIKRSL